MGLRSLHDKIRAKLEQPNLAEEEVLYLLIEVAKYLERSATREQRLNDADNLRIGKDDYPATYFFRNWAAHPEKGWGIPEPLRPFLEAMAGGDARGEQALLDMLRAEIAAFAARLGTAPKFDFDEFNYVLKLIVSEQPVKLPDGTWAGFDDQLVFNKL